MTEKGASTQTSALGDDTVMDGMPFNWRSAHALLIGPGSFRRGLLDEDNARCWQLAPKLRHREGFCPHVPEIEHGKTFYPVAVNWCDVASDDDKNYDVRFGRPMSQLPHRLSGDLENGMISSTQHHIA